MDAPYAVFMKIGADRPNPSPRPHSEAKSRPSDDKKGALVIIDSFSSPDSHGHIVVGAAEEFGSAGTVHRYHQHQMQNGRSTMPHVEAVKALQAPMASAILPTQEAVRLIEQFVENAAAGNLGLATSLLEKVTAEGFENSVVNYSQGLDPILLLQLAKHPLGKGSKLSDSQKQTYFQNLASAVASEAESPPQSAKDVDNLLLQKIKSSLKNSTVVQEATDRWAEQVREFESDNNSVVIAAGNSGMAIKGLAHAGFDIDGSEDFNIFGIEEATVVGAAVETAGGGIGLAPSSSFGPEVDFIASGQFGEHIGTSYASPKVANALRAAHVANPELSSEETEDWAMEELSGTGTLDGQQIAILDAGRTVSLLRVVEE